MDTDLQQILAEVEAYLAATGMSPSTFGKTIFRDGAVVRRMREGKPVTTATSSKMRRFMAEHPPAAPAADIKSGAAA